MKPALHSVSYAGFWGQAALGLEEFIPHAAKLGYQGVSTVAKRPHASVLDTPPERISRIRDLLKANKVECVSIAGYTDFSGSWGPGIPINEMQVSYVAELARMAKALDTKVVRIFTAYEHGTRDHRGLWASTVTALRECADRAAEFGVSIAVQNHHDVGVSTPAMFELLTEIGRANCKAGFDAWSPALCGENLYESARKMAPHTLITTCADYVRLPRFNYRPELTNYEPAGPDLIIAVPFGDGFIDYPSFFKGLRDGGFDGWAIYEMCEKLRGGGGIENLDHCARKFVEYMAAYRG